MCVYVCVACVYRYLGVVLLYVDTHVNTQTDKGTNTQTYSHTLTVMHRLTHTHTHTRTLHTILPHPKLCFGGTVHTHIDTCMHTHARTHTHTHYSQSAVPAVRSRNNQNLLIIARAMKGHVESKPTVVLQNIQKCTRFLSVKGQSKLYSNKDGRDRFTDLCSWKNHRTFIQFINT